jgi:hypothetical protein
LCQCQLKPLKAKKSKEPEFNKTILRVERLSFIHLRTGFLNQKQRMIFEKGNCVIAFISFHHGGTVEKAFLSGQARNSQR